MDPRKKAMILDGATDLYTLDPRHARHIQG